LVEGSAREGRAGLLRSPLSFPFPERSQVMLVTYKYSYVSQLSVAVTKGLREIKEERFNLAHVSEDSVLNSVVSGP
jgi:hypothetical protein